MLIALIKSGFYLSISPLYKLHDVWYNVSFKVNTRNRKTIIMKTYGLPPIKKKRKNKKLLVLQKNLCLCRLMHLHFLLELIVMTKHGRLPHGGRLTETVKSISRTPVKLDALSKEAFFRMILRHFCLHTKK